MENPELPREETLARLYQLQNQLEIDDVIMLQQLAAMTGQKDVSCNDCRAAEARVIYGRAFLCEPCAIMRIRMRRRLEPGSA